MLELSLLLRTELISILEEFTKLLFRQFDVSVSGFILVFASSLVDHHILHNRLAILINSVHLLDAFLLRLHGLHLLLVDEELFVLLWRQLLQELFLLLRVETLKRLHELHRLLVKHLLLHRRVLHPGVHDVLTLALFLLRRHLVDDLFLLLSLLLGHESSLLGCKLFLRRRLLGRMMTTAFESREEVVEKDALARLHLSPLALGGLFLAVCGSRLRCATTSRVQGVDVL